MFNSFRQTIRGKKDSQQKLQKITSETMNSPNTPSQNFEEELQDDTNNYYSHRQDDHRSPLAHGDGGMTCDDKHQIEKLRSVGKEMVKIIGRKILSGELNLTKISFPIKACAPKTALQNSIDSSVIFPHFMNRAALCQDPLERFKLTATAIISSTYYVKMFLKPLNPIIGETLQAELKDGTKIYCEQISHHPPISYFLIYGPDESYQFSGYYDFEISPGLNSLTLKNTGTRKFVFRDGSEISASFPSGVFNSTFFGTARVEETKTCLIQDKKNKIQLSITFDKVKKKPSDYFNSAIFVNGTAREKVFGTYCGYLEIGPHRYWDIRDFQPYDLIMCENKLESDWSLRPDLQKLAEERIEEGQKEKEHLEHIQRTDEKLRKKWKKQLKKIQQNEHE